MIALVGHVWRPARELEHGRAYWRPGTLYAGVWDANFNALRYPNDLIRVEKPNSVFVQECVRRGHRGVATMRDLDYKGDFLVLVDDEYDGTVSVRVVDDSDEDCRRWTAEYKLDVSEERWPWHWVPGTAAVLGHDRCERYARGWLSGRFPKATIR